MGSEMCIRDSFIALLLASREAWEVAWDEVRAPGVGKKLVTGVAGAAVVAMLVRFFAGPLGLILTGASIASLGALYARKHRHIWAQQERYRGLLDTYRVKHQRLRGKFIEGLVDEEERDLMIDGLLRRFLEELDEKPDLGATSSEGEDASLDEEE